MSTSAPVGRQERKQEKHDWDGVGMCGRKMMGILGEGCCGWNCIERGNGEGQRGAIRMR